MKTIFRNTSIKKIAFCLLTVFLFSFIHSELGQLSLKEDNHETHNFRLLVDGTNVQNTRIIDTKIFKLQVIKDLIPDHESDENNLLVKNSLDILQRIEKPPKSTITYLHNLTFLI